MKKQYLNAYRLGHKSYACVCSSSRKKVFFLLMQEMMESQKHLLIDSDVLVVGRVFLSVSFLFGN